MQKNRLNWWLDTVSLVILWSLLQTGLLMKYLLPPGSGHGIDGGLGLTLLGWNRHGWGNLHWWLGIALVGCMILHLALHWQWVIRHTMLSGKAESAKQRLLSNRRFVIGMGIAFLLLMATLTVGSLLLGYVGIRGVCDPHHDHDHDTANPSAHAHEEITFPHGDRRICGSLTLQQVAQNTGIPHTAILRELGFPLDTSPDIFMNQLARRAQIHMHEIRDVINKLHAAGEFSPPPRASAPSTPDATDAEPSLMNENKTGGAGE